MLHVSHQHQFEYGSTHVTHQQWGKHRHKIHSLKCSVIFNNDFI